MQPCSQTCIPLRRTFFRTVSVTDDPSTMAPVNSAKSAMVTACLWVIVLAATAVEKLFATSLAPGAPGGISQPEKERAGRKRGDVTFHISLLHIFTPHTDAECVEKSPEKSKNGKQWILPCDADVCCRNHVRWRSSSGPFLGS